MQLLRNSQQRSKYSLVASGSFQGTNYNKDKFSSIKSYCENTKKPGFSVYPTRSRLTALHPIVLLGREIKRIYVCYISQYTSPFCFKRDIVNQNCFRVSKLSYMLRTMHIPLTNTCARPSLFNDKYLEAVLLLILAPPKKQSSTSNQCTIGQTGLRIKAG